jgi:hypothetical protein
LTQTIKIPWSLWWMEGGGIFPILVNPRTADRGYYTRTVQRPFAAQNDWTITRS